MRRKKTGSMLLCALLALTLCLTALPKAALAAAPTTLTVADTSVIDGADVTYWKAGATTGSIAPTTAAANDWTVKYDPTTAPAATLTLRNATLYHTGNVIDCSGGDLAIVLEGSSYAGYDPSVTGARAIAGVSFNGSATAPRSLSIGGAGSLLLEHVSDGIFGYDCDVTMDDGTLEIVNSSGSSIDLSTSSGTLTVNGGSIEITNPPSYGISAQTLTVNDGSIDVSNCTGNHAIYVKAFAINGGSVHSDTSGSRGLYASATSGASTISGGEVTASGKRDGIFVYSELQISGGHVTAIGTATDTIDVGAFNKAPTLNYPNGYEYKTSTAPTAPVGSYTVCPPGAYAYAYGHRYVELRANYAVTYDANGGGGAMANGAATHGVDFTLPACGFTPPPNRRFKEWAIGSADSATRVAANGTHAFTAATTVYAIWEDASAPVLDLDATGSTSYAQGAAPGTASFLVTSNLPGFNAEANFDRATLDGAALNLGTFGNPGPDGKVENGSIKLTLSQARLNALGVGSHTLTIYLRGTGYAGRSVTARITVTAPAPAAVPKTGDKTPLLLLSALALLSGAGLAVSRTVQKRKKTH